MPPNARIKTTIGTATAMARVVVETPLLEFPAFEAAEVLQDVPVEVPEACSLSPALETAVLLVDAPVEVPEACSLPSFLTWPLDDPTTTDCQNSHLRMVTARNSLV